MTAREQILSAIAALLAPVPNITFYRSREAAIARSEGNTVDLRPEEESVELRTANLPIVRRNLTILVTLIVRGSDPSVSADQIADPLVEALHAALMADRTLGSLCDLVLELSTRWIFELADQTALAAELRYIVRYATSANDLAALT
jgi:1,6-anhydro-N-acetylmuramate kinase